MQATALADDLKRLVADRWDAEPWRDICLGNGRDACLLRVGGRFSVAFGLCARRPAGGRALEGRGTA